MKRGISVWLFSKIVMLVFLFTMFATMTFFMNLLNERIANDSAQSLILQIQDSIQSVVSIDALSHTVVVPIPDKLPEEVSGISITTGNRPYTLRVRVQPKGPQSGDNFISIALAWGTYTDENEPNRYTSAAASIIDNSVMLNDGKTSTVIIPSREFRFIKISEETSLADEKGICVQACREGVSACEPTCDLSRYEDS
ncbi:MAG: hypothetical protein J4432_01015 [DPANN group archaeon]|nr:hypothetical protein [DPANN group archaeon]